MSKLNSVKIIAVVVSFLYAFNVNAQIMRDSVEEVVITDSKIERPIRQTARPVEVITQSTVQKYIGKTLDQLLEDQVGVSINGGNSNPGSIKNIYVRGAAPGFTLILIDGLPASDASSIGSTIDFRLFDINQVERIEVAKGSQSTLYGSDAIAGVINIITKKGGTDAFNINANVSYGSYQTVDAGLSIGGSTGSLNYNAGYQTSSSDGLSEAFDLAETNSFDNDGFEKQVAYAKLKYDISEKWSISPSAQFSTFEGGYDAGSFTDGTDTYESDLTNLGIKLNYDSDNFKLNAAFNTIDAKRSFFTEFGDFLFDATTQNADVYATYQKGDISLIGGIHYQNASIIDEFTTEPNPSWNIFSPYANFIYLKNNFQVEAGLRFNNHSDFGSNLNYAITPSLFISDNFKVFASYATAFKAPALYELFGAFGANPDLQPQTSGTFELGSKINYHNGTIAVTCFNRNVEDVIVFTSIYENFAEQKDQGVEITNHFSISDGFNLSLSYAYLEGNSFDNNDVKTANLFKRPGHQVGFNLDIAASDKLDIRFINQWNSARTDLFFDFGTFTSSVANLKAYIRSDVSVIYQASDSIRLFGHVNNLWDNQYFETFGFTTQGINIRIGGSAQF